MTRLVLNNICKYFKGPDGIVRALDGVSMQINNGEFVAVQGPSGCGKTTLLLSAGVLLTPDEGTVVINEENPYLLPLNNRALFRASQIGFVFQQFHLVPYLTVKENIQAPHLALPQSGREKRTKELVERFGLIERIDHVPAELSTGERQRTALARAVFNSPKLLLADEPTGNLDNENTKIILRFFLNFAEESGSILMVTHDDSVAESAHRIIRLKNGKLVNA